MKKVLSIAAIGIIGLSGCVPSHTKVSPDTAQSMTMQELCDKGRYGLPTLDKPMTITSPSVYAEIKRRGKFNRMDLRSINVGLIIEGNTRKAMICALGQPYNVNSSSYGDSQYVYMGNKRNTKRFQPITYDPMRGYRVAPGGITSYYYVNDYGIVTAWDL